MRRPTPRPSSKAGIVETLAAAGILLALALAGHWSFGDHFTPDEQESIDRPAAPGSGDMNDPLVARIG